MPLSHFKSFCLCLWLTLIFVGLRPFGHAGAQPCEPGEQRRTEGCTALDIPKQRRIAIPIIGQEAADFWSATLTPVTADQWAQLMPAESAQDPEGCKGDCPLRPRTHQAALLYANLLSQAQGLKPCYRGWHQNTTSTNPEPSPESPDTIPQEQIAQCDGYVLMSKEICQAAQGQYTHEWGSPQLCSALDPVNKKSAGLFLMRRICPAGLQPMGGQCVPPYKKIAAGTYRGAHTLIYRNEVNYEDIGYEVITSKIKQSFWLQTVPVTLADWRAALLVQPKGRGLHTKAEEIESAIIPEENEEEPQPEEVRVHHPLFEAMLYANVMSDKMSLERCYLLDKCDVGLANRYLNGSFYCSSVVIRADCLGYRIPTEVEWRFAQLAGSPYEEQPLVLRGSKHGTNSENPTKEEKTTSGRTIPWAMSEAGWVNLRLGHLEDEKIGEANAWGLYGMAGSHEYGMGLSDCGADQHYACERHAFRLARTVPCTGGQELHNGRCASPCPPGQERVGDRCMQPCAFGETRLGGVCAPHWVHAPSGVFAMGAPDAPTLGVQREGPQHSVKITRPFWIQTTPVTTGDWARLMGSRPAYFAQQCGDDCPVESVNWFEALHYANRLSQRESFESCYHLEQCTGQLGAGPDGYEPSVFRCAIIRDNPECTGYRLPTEAEWAYAYRAGSTTAYYNGDLSLDERAISAYQSALLHGKRPQPLPKADRQVIEEIAWVNFSPMGDEDELEDKDKNRAGEAEDPHGAQKERAIINLNMAAGWRGRVFRELFIDHPGFLREIGGGASGGGTRPVRQKKPNAWGLYDMAGNVDEWVWDEPRIYTAAAQIDPIGSTQSPLKGLRGGSWASSPLHARAENRRAQHPETRASEFGFRLVRTDFCEAGQGRSSAQCVHKCPSGRSWVSGQCEPISP